MAPGYPLVPAIALVLAVLCLVAMFWFNLLIGLIFVGFLAVGFGYFQVTGHHRAAAPADALLARASPGRDVTGCYTMSYQTSVGNPQLPL